MSTEPASLIPLMKGVSAGHELPRIVLIACVVATCCAHRRPQAAPAGNHESEGAGGGAGDESVREAYGGKGCVARAGEGVPG